jgi:glutaconate CoA-transferase subunit A
MGDRPLTDAGARTSGRREVVADEETGAARLHDGMTVALGGFINAGHPMALVRQIIRRGLRELTVVGAASSGLDVDMLIAAGCVRKVIAPYVGAEGLAPIGPAFRHAVQEGALEVWELDEAHYYAGLRASAQRLPFNPWKAGVGTSYPEVNPDLKEFRDPVGGELLLAIPAIEIDVAVLHAAVSDRHGNVQHEGTGWGDRAIHAAADATIVQVERLISNEQTRRAPAATSIPGADLIVRAPFGAHPFASEGFYPPDEHHIREYVAAAQELLRTASRSRLDEYLGRYMLEPRDHVEYLERVGMRRLLELSEY